ncbi:MAG TPA: amidohydrolase family protein [Thermoleophilaceae bacterium]
MYIDSFTHFMPADYAARLSGLGETPAARNIRQRIAGIPVLTDLDLRLEQLEEFGDDYRQIISLPAPPLEDVGEPELSIELARIANDGFAELVREQERFCGFVAGLPLNDVDAAIAEAERACTELGALGVQVYTSVGGLPWDDDRFIPFFDAMARLDRTIWVHPSRNAQFADYPGEARSKYEIWWTYGWPYDTAVFMARLVFAGLFDRLPGIKILTHHGGGMTPHFAGRVGHGWDQLGARTPPDEAEDVAHDLEGRPLDYFKRFYADTAMFGAAPAIRCALEFFGPDQMLFASDSPFDPEKGPLYIRETIANLESLELPDGDMKKLIEDNARRVLGVEV